MTSTRGIVRAAALCLLAGVAVSGCSADGEQLDETVAALEEGLTSGDLVPVSTDVQDAAERYTAILEPLGDDVTHEVTVSSVLEAEGEATAELSWSWTSGEREWSWTTEADLVHDEDDGAWIVTWEPAIVAPGLEEGDRLDLTTSQAERGEILGAGDRPLVTDRPVVRLGLDKTQVKTGQVAGSARRIATALDVDAASFVERAEASGEAAFVEAIVMRTEDARSDVPPAYADIPGAVALDDELPLAPTSEFAAPILGTVGDATAEIIEESDGRIVAGDVVGLSGLQARYDERLGGTPGWQVLAVPAEESDAEARVLEEQRAKPGEPLRTTLDPELQTRAEQVLAASAATRDSASALVAIRPSDGAILAAASGPGSEGINTATFGQYAPGSTFKVVTSLALLRSGLTPDSPLECPATTVVDGKSFKNYDDYPAAGIGGIDLAAAVANSCNTAFIDARDRLDDDTLAEAAAALGLGVDHDLGFPAYFGQVPAPESETEAAAALIGQGRVLASPMTMAAVAASVQEGSTVLPMLLPDEELIKVQPETPLTTGEADALRGLMRGVVTSGSGRDLAPLGEVIAKTGTAEYGEAGASGELATHAWMIAARGDLAVAAFVETGESGSQTAGPLLLDLLR